MLSPPSFRIARIGNSCHLFTLARVRILQEKGLWVLSAHHFVLYSNVVIKHLEEEAELVERSERKPVATATNEFVGVEAVR
jgi:hypothetical protein